MIERVHQGLSSSWLGCFKVRDDQLANAIPTTAATRDAMIVQEEDGSEHGTGDAKPSEDMKRLNRVFSKNHAMSIHLNLITIGSVLFHGWILASSLGAKH